MASQNYEDYWKITLEYTDIDGERFIGTLKMIVDFIDQNKSKRYSEELFRKLQEKVNSVYHKEDMASVRKSINQFVKLGFVNFRLKSYHEDAPLFLEAKTSRRRKSIFSKIVYTNSSFNRSVTNDSDNREINFLIKTNERERNYQREHVKLKRKQRPDFKLGQNIMVYLRSFIVGKRISSSKLNYSSKDLKAHLEKQFIPEMNWGNYGTYWQIDHKVPITWFKTEKQIIQKGFALSNLQPLPAFFNKSKSNYYAYDISKNPINNNILYLSDVK
jgi:hypothetical protein